MLKKTNNLSELIESSWQIQTAYTEINLLDGQKPWGALEINQGLIGDIGELTEMLMAKYNLRRNKSSNLDKDLEHEIQDVLWSVLVLAKELKIDLNQTYPGYLEQMSERVKRLKTDRTAT